MKRKSTLKPSFNRAQMVAAIAAAPQRPVYDKDNPPTRPSDWKNAIVSRSLPELRQKLAERRSRGPGKRPAKVLLSVRYSPEVVAWFKAGGEGWQVRMNAALEQHVKRRVHARQRS